MEDRSLAVKAEHCITVNQRKELNINGVKDVKSFDEKSVVLDTQMGGLTVRGDGLHVGKLSIERGDVQISGRIDSLVYSDDSTAAKGAGLLAKLFG